MKVDSPMVYWSWIALKSTSVGSRFPGNIAATQGLSRFLRLSHCRRRLAYLWSYEIGSKSETLTLWASDRRIYSSASLPPLSPSTSPFFHFSTFFSYHAITSHIAFPLALQRKVTKRNITLRRPITINYIHSHSHLGRRLTIVAYT